ncbi:WD domain, G-beta repeat-containing protein [Toxoplasma gondii TgCatPRC2]|uniref:WD domain, G-beta repeat-containing protein n=4 Tax=Toxoplasma gondii TaxID=5811 RepID=A0A151HDA5_TOXGO|nr:WD domain, G-beta repeat-containing protein [Toxoplasma gondii ME49]EPT31713.1 WD domain, G-beta repeat-containing protein [Toxoplasma gondii ME49]KYF41989.1 WD domain, G-beta repeat-containing protein [Toxoplasma gondii ARI]KYK67355.1 WD domain, G-beta repeat-containing protein [Toxoplasma gondii TgCatPRC2]PIL98060.1 WD domain, G-beta repeat-containing protein [Toxoplasma gondii COUG]|eukprot:XP_002369502.1 WD domain, G-beta repeat-containing protein [Toxoplasma gondii ME49]
MSRLVSTSGRPVNPGDICPIRSTVRTPPSSPLPLFPAVPFLVHPHRPVLFWCTSTSLYAYDFLAHKWMLPSDASSSPSGPSSHSQTSSLSSLQHALPVAAADCVCQGCGATSSRLRSSGRREREQPGCLVRATASKAGGEAGDSATEDAGAANAEKSQRSRCLWVTAGEDKYVHLVSDVDFRLLQKRQQRKKLSAAVFLLKSSSSSDRPSATDHGETSRQLCGSAAQETENGDRSEEGPLPLLLADKFGDVYHLSDCWRMQASQALAGDRLVKRMQSLASVHGLRTRDAPAAEEIPTEEPAAETESLGVNPMAAESVDASAGTAGTEPEPGNDSESLPDAVSVHPNLGEEDDEEGGEDIPIISHLTTITVLKVVDVFSSVGDSSRAPLSAASGASVEATGEGRREGTRQTLLITADRDEKVRVCFLDQPWSVESFFLGHGDFVTDVVVLSNFADSLGDAQRGDARTGTVMKAVSTDAAPGDAGREIEGANSRTRFLRQAVASCAGDGTVKLWRLADGMPLSDNSEVLLEPQNLFDEPACAVVRAHALGGRRAEAEGRGEQNPGEENEARGLPQKLAHPVGLNEDVLLPAALLHDADQSLLIVQCLALKGLLLFPLDANTGGGTSSTVCTPGAGLMGRKPFFLPLPAVPAATLLLRHSVAEVEKAPALSATASLLRAFLAASPGKQPPLPDASSEFDLPFVWWIDDAGRLRPPVAVSLPLLAFAESRQVNEPQFASQVLPYLSGNADECFFPAPADGARPNYLYLWKSTRSPTCPTDEERRAKRLRHKHLQQQQQQEIQERSKRSSGKSLAAARASS